MSAFFRTPASRAFHNFSVLIEITNQFFHEVVHPLARVVRSWRDSMRSIISISLFFILALVVACAPGTGETSSRHDHSDSVVIDTIQSILSTAVPSTQELNAFGLTPDEETMIQEAYHEGDSIESVEKFEMTRASYAQSCMDGTLFVVRRSNANDETYEDYMWMLEPDKESKPFVSVDVSFETTDYQSETKIYLADDFKLSDQCEMLILRRTYAGGDIEWAETSSLYLYLVSREEYTASLNLVFEFTEKDILTVDDYERIDSLDTDENQGDGSLTRRAVYRTLEVLPSKTNGLHDFRLMEEDRTQASDIKRTEVIYQFNGSDYLPVKE